VCKVVVRPTKTSWSYLNLREILLYRKDGSVIPPASLGSHFNTADYDGAANCADGKVDAALLCHSGNSPLPPTLTISYECGPSGTTGGTLAKVEVYNRAESCCQSRIQDYMLEYVNASGAIDAATYLFTESRPVYNVAVASFDWSSTSLNATSGRCFP
jgi:hypothetical protein